VRLLLYTGKGGVGKTTTAAATAVRAAERGLRTLVASADAAHSLGDVFLRRIGPEPAEVAPGLDAIEIDARIEMIRHWGRIRDYLIALLRHQGIDGVVAEELALLPGAEELTTLLAVEKFALSSAYDLVVLDCAPTDSTLRLVTLPDVAHRSLRILLPLLRAIAGVATPLARTFVSVPLPDSGVFRDADELLYGRLRGLQKRIADPGTSVRIVVTPERMVIDEARRTYTELSLFEVAGEEAFFRDWVRIQAARRRELEEYFAPLPVLLSPLQDDEVTGLARLADQGRRIFAGTGPEVVLARPPRLRFGREGAGYVARVPIPGVDAAGLGVVKVDDELTITTGGRRRSLKLPRRIAPLPVSRAHVDGSCLVVHFAADASGAEAR
jgi:arsenite-transporting ATPase